MKPLSFVSLIQFFMLTLCIKESKSCLKSEKKALLNILNDMYNEHDSRHLLPSWSKEANCCLWQGVNCNNTTGHVVALDLRNVAVGISTSAYPCKLSLSLLDLTQIRYLDLSMNNFSGVSIPSFIGSLGYLEYLNLSNTGFTGTIPHTFGSLSNLQFLDLNSWLSLSSYNLQWVSNMTSLQHLDLGGVFMPNAVGWINDINSLSNLSVLKLANAGLMYIPSTLQHNNLTSLTTIDLSGNYFFSDVIPVWLTNISSLVHLDIGGCGFRTGSQIGLADLNNLKYLNLWNNQFGAEILESIWNLSRLQHLDMSWNGFNGCLPDSFSNLRDLKYIDLTRSQIFGSTPNSLWTLNSLQFLDISDNGITGIIPEMLGNLTNLELLDISRNKISGVLPKSIGSIHKLNELCLDENNIEGVIPNSIGYLANLNSLKISMNSISGQIPESICNLTNLIVLDLSDNNITGKLPKDMGNLHSLNILDLSSNGISDQLPEFASTTLYDIDLSNNNLEGSLLLWFENFTAMTSVQVIDLSNNKFSGEIPDGLMQRFELSFLNLSRNSFTGQIPNNIGGLLQLRSLDLSLNNLSGEIPSSMTKMHFLGRLNLSRNSFTGQIPNNIGGLLQLQSLDLSLNNLSGEIPSSMTKMYFLGRLNLSCNRLSGVVPIGYPFSTFSDQSIYAGNDDLCGWPLPNCHESERSAENEDTKEHDDKFGVAMTYVCASLGFIFGFWTFVGFVTINWRIRGMFIGFVDKFSG